jgi:hypothetical protein
MTLLMQFSLAITSSHSCSQSDKKQARYEMSEYPHYSIIKLDYTVHVQFMQSYYQKHTICTFCINKVCG